MRLWSLHPNLLDAKGLVALWRESLLAQKVLKGETRGYTRHPQLIRFRNSRHPLNLMAAYLWEICYEAKRRNYHFDRGKISGKRTSETISVTTGQLDFERGHLLKKLKLRDPKKYKELLNISEPYPHPVFRVRSGGIEDWEKI